MSEIKPYRGVKGDEEEMKEGATEDMKENRNVVIAKHP